MSNEHIPSDRLHEAAEGLGLDTTDVEHLRNCLECRAVLRVITRLSIQRLRGTEPPEIAIDSDGSHPGLGRLWNHAHGSETIDEDTKHISQCERCVGILWICRSGKPLEEIVQLLKEHGFDGYCLS